MQVELQHRVVEESVESGIAWMPSPPGPSAAFSGLATAPIASSLHLLPDWEANAGRMSLAGAGASRRGVESMLARTCKQGSPHTHSQLITTQT